MRSGLSGSRPAFGGSGVLRSGGQMEVREPHRATRSGSFRLRQDADLVYPLFCPVREREWLASWSPERVYSRSGAVEPECVFTSSDEHGRTTWLVSRHDPPARVVHMVRLTPDLTACLVEIAVRPLGPAECEVFVSYSHTALSPAGEEFVDGFSEAAYAQTMERWKAALEHFFERGSPMPGS